MAEAAWQAARGTPASAPQDDPPAVPRRPDLAEMKQAARRLEADNPRWIVLFGDYSRQFVAFPRFDVPTGTVLSALYPDALPPRMRRIEAKARPAASGPRAGDAPTVMFRLAG